MKSILFKEEWKDITGYEGLYQVSNLGRIKSLDRYIKGRNNCDRLIKGQIINTYSISNSGYKQIRLSLKHKKTSYYIHRLVAQAFLPNPENLPEVDHINTFKDDNSIWNLQWVPHIKQFKNPITKKNMSKSHSGERGASYGKFGKDHHSSKPVLQYDLDGNFIKEWECTMQVQRELGIRFGDISACCRHYRYHKTAGGYKWEFKNNN